MAEQEEGPTLLVEAGDWHVYADTDSGQPYFYNAATEVTQWELPEELKGNAEVEALMVVEEQQEEQEQAVAEGEADEGEEGGEEILEGGWAVATDEEGQVYYYNVDGRTQWDMPEELKGRYGKADGGQTEEEAAMGKDGGEDGELEEGELEEGEVEEGEEEEGVEEERAPAVTVRADRWTEQPQRRWGDGAGSGASGNERYPWARDRQPPVSSSSSPRRSALPSTTYAPPASAVDGAMAAASRYKPPKVAAEGGTAQRRGPSFALTTPSPEKRPRSESGGEREQEAVHAPGGEGQAEGSKKSRSAVEEEGPRSPEQPPPATAAEAGPKPGPIEPTSPPMPPHGAEGGEGMGDAEEMEVVGEELGAEDGQSGVPAWLEEAEQHLRSEDSIMEPGIYAVGEAYEKECHRLAEVGLTHHLGNRLSAEELLASAYRGYANMAIMVAGWLQNLSTDGTEQDLEAKELVLDHLGGQIKASFDVGKADALLFGQRKDMLFVDDMMQHQRWRRLLMEVFAENKQSQLLGGYCMQHMSRAGHNTEMADIISVTDYWGVARGVLTELLAEVPFADHVSLWRTLSNLKRMCCPTAYLHLFAQQTLARLEERLLTIASALPPEPPSDGDAPTKAQSVIASARKYRRIREELEKAAWEAKSEDHTRARFVHKISAWHRPRRRRLSGQAEEGGASAMEVDGQGLDEDSQHRLVEVVLTVLAERTLTVRALDRLTDAYVQEGVFKDEEEEEDMFGGLGGMGLSDDESVDPDAGLARVRGPLELLRHPQVLELLVRSIFDPKRRLSSEDQRRSACRVMAVASCAMDDATLHKADAQTLYVALVRASKTLADEEVLRWGLATSSIPTTLKSLLRHPPVAMGFLLWLRATVQDPDFHTSRQFHDVMQVFLRLLQFLACDSPLHQPAVFAALKAVLCIRPSDNALSVTKVKRQALQCCVHLMAQGFVLPVLDFIRSGVKDMDHALIRHFVGMGLGVAKPPYSPVFARSMAGFLREPAVSKALKTNLEDSHRRHVAAFVEHTCRDDAEDLDPAMRKGLLLVFAQLSSPSQA